MPTTQKILVAPLIMKQNCDYARIISVVAFITFSIFPYYFVNKSRLYLSNHYILDKPIEHILNTTLLHINGKIKRIGNIEQIYVINLPKRQDRRIGSIALFQTLDWNAFIVPAYTIHSSEVVSRTHLTHEGRIRLVEIACWASHLQIWHEIARLQNDTWVLIVEDDIDLEFSTFDILQSFPSDVWTVPDLLYLGYCGNAPGLLMYRSIQNSYRIHQATNPSCTHAYAIRSRSATKLIQLLSKPLKAIDDTIVDLANDNKIIVFSIHPPLAIQQSITSLTPSDINPAKTTIAYRLNKWFNLLIEKWKGVEFIDRLQNSTLAYADFKRADKWLREHEKHY